MDAQLGRVLHWLRANGFDENTVVVVSSDNGAVTSNWINWWEVNAYGSTGGFRGRKHYLYEGGIRVPAVIRYPNVTTPGSVSDAPVIGMDLFVTLANIGGGKVPDDRHIDGIDIQAVFSGADLPQRSLFWAMNSVSDLEYAIRKGSWKLLLDRNHVPRELYNLDEDPLEFFNLINQQESITKQLASDAERHIASIDADPLRPDTAQEYQK
jgi:arylsulfatase A-like enzyme